MEISNKKDLLAVSKLLNVFLAVGFLVSSFTSIGLGGALAYISLNESRTLVPPTLSRAFSVSDGDVDEAYLFLMGSYFLHLKYDITPASVSRQYGLLLDYVPSDFWADIQPSLMSDAEQIIDSNISSRFVPDKDGTLVALDAMQFQQTGTLYKSVGDRDLDPEKVTYRVQMSYPNGVLELMGITKQGD
ncbi:type IV conjugative transfer system protein TraE [Vibrio sp. THAF190c]|uniref:type IV conjugative transfer system protein TraE n=1 Tax=Vibrio sp. THAF190c TaxID=2587865 RepID=UPI001268AD35|nr:type IV conjugative transfer system protein TraE [Vibrio sp. THAF190c]QFT13606.1 TraE protein [Vibrio sp. THAF190c]